MDGTLGTGRPNLRARASKISKRLIDYVYKGWEMSSQASRGLTPSESPS